MPEQELCDVNNLKTLIEKFDALLIKNNFKPRDIVTWKEGLRNKMLPNQEQPALVLEVLSEPIICDDQEKSSPYFREPLDIVLAMLDEDGDLVCFYYDSRRFEPYKRN